jgi:outer membrane protein assembly factor BamE (lipoprotein component of BamABCDE complex)
MRKLVMLISVFVACLACAGTIDQASASYKRNRDFVSLEKITHRLRKGMTLAQVQDLLGPEDSSPTDGVYIYSSDRRQFLKDIGREATVVLIVEFRIENGAKETSKLQSWEIMPIGE